MAWTSSDLADVETAIKAITLGAQSYSINGRTVSKANLAELRSLRREMQAELGVSSILVVGRLTEP